MHRTYVVFLCVFPAFLASRLSTEVRGAEPFDYVAAKLEGKIVMPWKTLRPDRAYHGQWLVAGDLDGDGLAEIVTARHDSQSVTTVLVMKLNGSVLWKWGRPNTGKQGLYCDVPVQIYDLDGDGKVEVYVSTKGFLLVLDGATGKELRRLPLPKGLAVADCITFVNLRGLKRPRDIIVKTRYRRIWAYTDDWKPLWTWEPSKYMSCHHPTPVDVDGDGRDEIICGYTMLDDKGKELWTIAAKKTNQSKGHVDCSEVLRTGKRPEDFRIVLTYCGANCIAMTDGAGKTLWELTGHHFESVDIAKIRKDVPGKQIVVDIDHRPFGQGPVWLLDDKGNRLGSWTTDYGRHHRLIDWDGDGLDEALLGNARGVFNGHGKCVAKFGPAGAFDKAAGPQPPGNDPGPLAAVGDLDGDGRPEVILHSTSTVRIYKSAKAGKIAPGPVGTGVNFTLY